MSREREKRRECEREGIFIGWPAVSSREGERAREERGRGDRRGGEEERDWGRERREKSG